MTEKSVKPEAGRPLMTGAASVANARPPRTSHEGRARRGRRMAGKCRNCLAQQDCWRSLTRPC
ncbi:hypothetical protein [Kitasatospora sp. NPDC091276]|uniref:hypothetical protein n=1 Tax=Kitasatospora sp. NPDC091276 TaxID=3155300 RepID=UPI00341B1B4A